MLDLWEDLRGLDLLHPTPQSIHGSGHLRGPKSQGQNQDFTARLKPGISHQLQSKGSRAFISFSGHFKSIWSQFRSKQF